MNDQSIFLAALDIADLSERSAYVKRTCAGDPTLLQQVESLLAAHDKSGQFLDVPALQQVTPGASDGQATDETMSEHHAKGSVDLSFLQPSTQPGSLGRLGHYEVQAVIGQGGCGIVLKAFDEILHRLVAIKLMAPELAATSPARKRFLREARAAAAIRHENVVSIHAVEEKPIPFLVMEYIAGQTLQQKLDQNGPLDVQEVVQIGSQIANGLDAAHAIGLIHRDIKPGNILLEHGRDRIKITDFGLARTTDDASITQSGVIAGTPLYMSPEQARGTEIDPRSDLFSLGSVLYVMCSGRPPFRAANTLAVLKRVAEEQPRSIKEIIPEVPDWLVAIINRLLAKNPAERFASAKEVGDLLARCLSEMQHRGRVASVSDLLTVPKQENVVEASVPVAPRIAPTPVSVPAKPPLLRNNRLVAAAATLLLLLGGLSLSEATGVTTVRNTVIRLFSAEGTLVIEVDDPGVSISIDGEELVITGSGAREIRLKVGQYKVLASKDGKLLKQELVTVSRNGRQVLRVSKEGQPGLPIGDTINDADRRAAEWVLSVGGNVRVVEGDQVRWAAKVADLPAQLWELNGVSLTAAGRNATNAGLANLSGCVNLRILHLGRMGVTDEGLAHLKGLSGLTDLALSGARLTPAGLEQLRDYSGLVLLDLDHVPVTDADLAKLTGLEKMAFLTLSHTQVTDVGLAHLSGLTHLQKLHLAGTKVTDTGLAHLKAFEALDHLYLDGTSIGDAGLVHLRPLKHLNVLGLGSTQVTNAGLAHLKELKSLTTLGLDSTQVTDAGIDALADCAALRAIFLKKTKVSEAGAKKLAAKVPGCRIEWDGGVIEPTVSPDRRAAEWVLLIGGTVRINGLERDISAADELPKEQFVLTMVNLTKGEKLTDDGLAHFRNCKGLKTLHLWGPLVTDVRLAHFQDCTSLTDLRLPFTAVTDAGLVHFKNCKGLIHLDLASTAVTDAGLAHFEGCKDLVDLCLYGTGVSDAGLAYFKDCKQLATLRLEHTQVTDAGLACFKDCKDLYKLLLNGTQVTDAGLAHFKDCKKFGWIHLEGTQVTVAGLAWFKDSKSPYFDLRGTQISDADLKELAGMTKLFGLDLRKTKVTPAGIGELKKALPKCQIEYDGKTDPDRRPQFQVGGDWRIEEGELVQALPENSRLFFGDANWTDYDFEVEANSSGKTKDGHGICLMFRAKDLGNYLDLEVGGWSATVTEAIFFKDGRWGRSPGCFLKIPHEHGRWYKVKVEVRGARISCRIDGKNVFAYSDETLLKGMIGVGTGNSPVRWRNLKVTAPDGRLMWEGFPDLADDSPRALSDPDRRAAEYVLSVGGAVRVNDKFDHITKASELPDQPFRLNFIQLDGKKEVDDAAVAIFKDCRHLNWLGLGHTSVTDAGLVHFKDRQLHSLDIKGTAVTDAGLVHFKNCKNLAELSLGGTQITDAGLENFKECQILQYLWLDGTKITDAGLALFKGCKKLTMVDLRHTAIGDPGLAHLADCVELRQLYVEDTRITSEGIGQLRQSLPRCTIVWNGGTVNPTGLVEVDRRAAEYVLSIGGTVTVNNLNGVMTKVSELPTGPIRLTHVYLTYNQKVTDEGLVTFEGCKHLRKLALSATPIGPAGVAHFKDSKDLVSLHLHSELITDEALQHCKDFENLLDLKVSSTQVTDAGLAYFQGFKNLTSLDLTHTPATDTGLTNFKDCKKLKTLLLGQTKATDAGLALFKGCTNLETIALFDTFVTDDGLALFKDCKSLVNLHLDQTAVTGKCIDVISGFSKLRRVTLKDTTINEADVKMLAEALPLCKIEWKGGVIEPK